MQLGREPGWKEGSYLVSTIIPLIVIVVKDLFGECGLDHFPPTPTHFFSYQGKVPCVGIC